MGDRVRLEFSYGAGKTFAGYGQMTGMTASLNPTVRPEGWTKDIAISPKEASVDRPEHDGPRSGRRTRAC